MYVFVRSGTIWTQQAYLKASNARLEDQFGYSVAISGDSVVVGAISEAGSGAAYVFVRSGTIWTQQAYFKAFNPVFQGYFGGSVAISGDTVVVGAYGESSSATGVNGNGAFNSSTYQSGAAYVFVRSGTTWTQQAYLKASNTDANDNFGYSVAISGDTVVVGAYAEDSNAQGVNGNQDNNFANRSGAVYVFARSGTIWTQQAYLKASNAGASHEFGFSVAISGDSVVVGAIRQTGGGAAYVFVRSGTNWSQQAFLKASNAGSGDLFGSSVAISGDSVVVGANSEYSHATGVNGNEADNSARNAGAAYVFVRSGSTWTQQAYVKASHPPVNDGGSSFGYSVAVSGNTVVVGAPVEDSNAMGVDGDQANNIAVDSGAAYVFFRSGNIWTQQAYLKASNTGTFDFFGSSVAVSGDTVVVGAYSEASIATGVNGNQLDNSALYSGAAYVFIRSGATWTQQAYLKASNTGANDGFGGSVAVSGETVVVGARGEDSNTTGVNGDQANNNSTDSGAAYVFVRSGTTWTQQAYLKASNTAEGDYFGGSVAISGDTVVVGAAGEHSNATGVNGNQLDNSALYSGAAYVFIRSGATWTQQAYLKASNTGASDGFGGSVAVSGETVVVGARGEDSNTTGVNGDQANNSASASGAAYVFIRSGTAWTQQAYLKASNTDREDTFGLSVAVSGETVVVGARVEDSNATGVNGNQADNSAADSGAAYVFVRSGTTWNQEAYLKASNTVGFNSYGDRGWFDLFGQSVAVSGDTVVVGAPDEDSNAIGVNGNPADNLARDAGAAYVFLLPLPTPTSPLAAPVTVCGGAPVALSAADPGPGIVIDWFANSCGGTLLGTGNPFTVNPVATTTYFARARNPSSGSTSDSCAAVVVTVGRMDYNRDGFLNCDDLCDFITDFYMDPPIPGGLQPLAPTYANLTIGYGIGCSGAADAPAPYATNAYRTSGYRVGFSPDGSNSCPISPDQNFPNLDHLADFITEYYAAFTAGGC